MFKKLKHIGAITAVLLVMVPSCQAIMHLSVNQFKDAFIMMLFPWVLFVIYLLFAPQKRA